MDYSFIYIEVTFVSGNKNKSFKEYFPTVEAVKVFVLTEINVHLHAEDGELPCLRPGCRFVLYEIEKLTRNKLEVLAPSSVAYANPALQACHTFRRHGILPSAKAIPSPTDTYCKYNIVSIPFQLLFFIKQIETKFAVGYSHGLIKCVSLEKCLGLM